MVKLNENAVKEAAYYNWQNAGCPQGNDEYFWAMALEQLSYSNKASCSKTSCKTSSATKSSSASSAKKTSCKTATCKSSSSAKKSK